jgi:hypothetical protein
MNPRHRLHPCNRLLASVEWRIDAQAQHEVAGNRLHKRSAEVGWTEFAPRAQRVCQIGISQQPDGKTKVLFAYRDMPLQFVTVYEHKD